jgi:hypothetical protein
MRRHRRPASACLHRGCVAGVLLVMAVSMGCDSSSPVTSALAPDRIPPSPAGSAPVGPTGSYIGPNWINDLFCSASDHHFSLLKR